MEHLSSVEPLPPQSAVFTPSPEELRCLLLHDNCAIAGVCCQGRRARDTAPLVPNSAPVPIRDPPTAKYKGLLNRLEAERKRDVTIDVSLWNIHTAQPSKTKKRKQPDYDSDGESSYAPDIETPLESVEFDSDWDKR